MDREKHRVRRSMTVAEAGRRGGALGGAETKARYGQEYYRDIGRKGGRKVAERGPAHFQEIGRKGGALARELWAAVRAYCADQNPDNLGALGAAALAYRDRR